VSPNAEAGPAGDAASLSEMLLSAREYHRLAMQGDESALTRADEALDRILAEDKSHAEALAIRGSLLTIKAKLTRSFPKRLYYSYKAVRVLNRAVEADPGDAAARTIRGFTSLVLPGFLRRLKVAAEDFEYLIRRYQEDPSVLPDEMMPKIYLNLGIAYAKEGKSDKARKTLADVTERFPDSRESDRAQSMLARLANKP
jgi:tetratricopeptide (TPR) repeat protein